MVIQSEERRDLSLGGGVLAYSSDKTTHPSHITVQEDAIRAEADGEDIVFSIHGSLHRVKGSSVS